MSDFIVSDSYSDSEEEHQSSVYRSPLRLPVKHWKTDYLTASTTDRSSPHTGKGACWAENHSLLGEHSVNANESPIKKAQEIHSIHPKSSVDISLPEDGLEEPDSVLKFSPPRLKSPSRSPPAVQARTPSRSPSKSKLVSPTKRARIPPSPHRPSIDAFWSQEVVNNWNDQHSPKKTPKSSYGRKIFTQNEDDPAYLSPCEGRKSPSKSPVKPDKQDAEKRKAFNEKKHQVAALFLDELDRTIMDGQIAKLAESTGGVHLVWSKKLQSTAGRANWRREAVRSKDADGAISSTRYRHHASIELAEKVIDDEDRLINVIAHEYCHLLNFMVSNVKDNPHGKEFKTWARKCSTAFAHRGVNVTTKHTYEISYNKSVDPTRHSCGKCKGKLLQIKPIPRGEGKGISEYQQFVKEHFAKVKKEKPKMSMGEVMAVLGREFREKKEKQKMVMVVIEEEVDADKVLEEEGDCGKDDTGLDSMVQKLDVLHLGSK
ncbi:MAG: hypothetical protein LQ352_000216 [Teloschistes flavicans]|nr:MAG: hypothetical protein LQ352_000216 [Teloschistes flavicans]